MLIWALCSIVVTEADDAMQVVRMAFAPWGSGGAGGASPLVAPVVRRVGLCTSSIPDVETRRILLVPFMLLVVGGLLGAVALASIGAVPTLWIAVVIAASQGVFLLRVGVPRRGAPRPDEVPPNDGAPPPHTRRAY